MTNGEQRQLASELDKSNNYNHTLGVVAQAHNYSPCEAEAKELLRIGVQPGLYGEFKASVLILPPLNKI